MATAGTQTPDGSRTAGALPLGRVLGVPVELAPSWFLLAALVVGSYGPVLARRGGVTGGSVTDGTAGGGYLAAAAFAALLLASVLLHEVGHCVAARLLGLRVRRIRVSFLAGLTEITDPPPAPAQAYAVAIAGPLVSVLLSGLAVAAAATLEPGSAVRAVVGLCALSNGGLAVFNLLPGLPLDGGAVLRAAVWGATGDPLKGTVVSAQAGRVLAVVPLSALVLAPLLGARLSTPGLVTAALVALFLYGGSTAALRSARAEQRLSGVAAAVLARPALPVPAGMPLAEALRRAHAGVLHAMVVVDAAGRPVAVVSEAAVAAVPEHRRPWVAVGGLARPLADGLLLDPDVSGAALLDAVRRTPASEYVVRGAQPRVLVAADLAHAVGARGGAVA